MNYILNAEAMRNADKRTISEHGIPALVLMERAALSVVSVMNENGLTNGFTVIVCGTGNNAADGVAIARMLHLKGDRCAVILVGDSNKHTEELSSQINSAVSYGVAFYDYAGTKAASEELLRNADTVVDAIFGIGLSKDVKDDFAEVIELINNSDAFVVSVDIPSGYSTDTGVCLSHGVRADITVCFSYLKKGLLLSDCYLNAGTVIVKDVGIYVETCETDNSEQAEINSNSCSLCEIVDKISSKDIAYQITDEDLSELPKKHLSANKGSVAKILVIAGSEEIYGACYLSAFAAMKSGSGYVKIFTHKNNIKTLQKKLPEAVCISYDDSLIDELANHEATQKCINISKCDADNKLHQLDKAMDFADAVLIGPGLSMNKVSEMILEYVVKNITKPLVIDADGLNILAGNKELLMYIENNSKAPVIITPHLLEMSRLTGISVNEINNKAEEIATEFSKKYGVITVLKNYTTVITDGNKVFINSSGDEALATAGSGDVLAGIIAAFAGMKKMRCNSVKAVAISTYIHGKAGAKASEKLGTKNIVASDIIKSLGVSLKQRSRGYPGN